MLDVYAKKGDLIEQLSARIERVDSEPIDEAPRSLMKSMVRGTLDPVGARRLTFMDCSSSAGPTFLLSSRGCKSPARIARHRVSRTAR